MNKKGRLYLLPAPLGDDAVHVIPAYVVETIHKLTFLVAEKAKTARHFIKKTNPPKPIGEFVIHELDEHTPAGQLPLLLKPLLAGQDVGLLSEAGCPGIADPGAALVELAHQNGIEVAPLVGPSSILLALMASGMNGQRFCFNGYLSPRANELAKDLKRLESLSERHDQTQVFIETPYRNKQILEQALVSLSPGTKFCVAADLTLPTQFILTKPIESWQKEPLPDLHKRPTVFLLHRKK